MLVVRDPFEVIMENLHTEVTQTITEKCEVSLSHSQWLEKFISIQIAQLEKFWEHIMKEFRTRNVPVYYIKYEDLIENYKDTMLSIAKFLMNTKSIEGTVIEERVMMSELMVNPQLRTYRNTDDITEDQKVLVKTKLYDMMEFFGYFKARKLKQGNHGVHSYPELLYNIREKYKKNLVDPTGGKEPLKYREYVEANVENTKKNATYKLEYRKKKMLDINKGSNLPEVYYPKMPGTVTIEKKLDYTYDPNEEALAQAQ